MNMVEQTNLVSASNHRRLLHCYAHICLKASNKIAVLPGRTYPTKLRVNHKLDGSPQKTRI